MKPAGPIQSMPHSSPLPWVIAASAVTFTLGVTGAVLFTQNRANAQADMMATMAAQLMQLQQEGVTRNASPDLLAVQAPVAATVAPTQVAAVVQDMAEPVSDYLEIVPATPLPEMTTIDLSENGRRIAASATTIDANFDPNTANSEETISTAIASVNQIALGVLDGDYSVVSERDDNNNARLRLDIPAAAQTTENLEILLARAAANGDIALLGQTASPDGTVDPQILLFDLVQRALENGGAAEADAAAELRRRASLASSVEADVVEGERIYTVEAGDSLAYISLQFYGSTGEYGKIFEANRAQISSPDKIQVGQRLVIPSA